MKASLFIALSSVRSERAFCEELEYNLLFRWFLGMNLMERSFDPTVFTKNRQPFLSRKGQQLFDAVVAEAHERSLLSDEHCTVDGTLIEAAASLKSFRRRDGDPPFRGKGPPTMSDQDPSNPRWTSLESGGSTPPTGAPRTRRPALLPEGPACSGRARGRKPSWLAPSQPESSMMITEPSPAQYEDAQALRHRRLLEASPATGDIGAR